MNEDHIRGKTIRLMESAIDILGELPENANVYITGPHTKWLKELEYRFKKSGLVDVVFINIHEINNGRLRGCRGRLLIDDPQDVTSIDWEMLVGEKRILESKNY